MQWLALSGVLRVLTHRGLAHLVSPSAPVRLAVALGKLRSRAAHVHLASSFNFFHRQTRSGECFSASGVTDATK